MTESARQSRVSRSVACVIITVALIALAAGDASAQQREPPALLATGLFGTGIVDRDVGLTAGVGAGFGTKSFVVRALFDLHLVEPDEGAYSWELASDGVECREDSSNRVVDGSLCGVTRAVTGISTDLSAIVPAF